MAGTGPEDLQTLAQELLDACIDALDSIPLSAPDLGGAPERTFIAAGVPVWDCCEQMAVHVSSLTEAPTSPGGLATGRRASAMRINLARLVVTLTRCVPVSEDGEPPPAALLTASAEQINADAWAIWNHLYDAIRAGTLFALCLEVFWEGMTAVNPSGGCAGWQIAFRVRLDGYEEP